MPRYHQTCLRCQHQWRSFKDHPIVCAQCKSYQWDQPIIPRWVRARANLHVIRQPVRVEDVPTAYWQIPLTRDKVALIDDCDYATIGRYNWTAMCVNGAWYAIRCVRKEGKRYSVLMHRQILGSPTGSMIDHRDRNGLNNRRQNLRYCSNSQNQYNSKPKRTNKCGFKGVYWHKTNQKWAARITVDGKVQLLGYFTDLEAAGTAYDRAALQLCGMFARPNHITLP